MLRTDEHWLDERWADPATRVLVIAGARVRPVDGRLAWVSPQEAPDGLRVLLGERDGVAALRRDRRPRRGARRPRRVGGAARGRAVARRRDHRRRAAGAARDRAGRVALATRHCPRCGGALEPRQAGHVLHCTSCGRDQFPRSDPAVIMVVTDGEPGSPDERALLGRSPAWPQGRYSTLAGLRRARRDDGGRRTPRGRGGDRRQGRRGVLLRQPALAAAGQPDGRLHRAGRRDRPSTSTAPRSRTPAGSPARRCAPRPRPGTLVLPGGVSISRSLVESWYGGPLPGRW